MNHGVIESSHALKITHPQNQVKSGHVCLVCLDRPDVFSRLSRCMILRVLCADISGPLKKARSLNVSVAKLQIAESA